MAVTINGTNGITFNNSSTQAQSAGLGSSATAQTWQNMTASRALGTTYTNSTGYPIQVSVITNGAGSANNSNQMTVSGNVVNQWVMNTSGGMVPNPSSTAIVPNGATYSVAASHALITWWELR